MTNTIEPTTTPRTPYRVFLDRHYIAVEWFDILATSGGEAKRLALTMANTHSPNPRDIATDNGWHIDGEANRLDRIGQCGQGKQSHPMVKVGKSQFVFAFIDKSAAPKRVYDATPLADITRAMVTGDAINIVTHQPCQYNGVRVQAVEIEDGSRLTFNVRILRKNGVASNIFIRYTEPQTI